MLCGDSDFGSPCCMRALRAGELSLARCPYALSLLSMLYNCSPQPYKRTLTFAYMLQAFAVVAVLAVLGVACAQPFAPGTGFAPGGMSHQLQLMLSLCLH